MLLPALLLPGTHPHRSRGQLDRNALTPGMESHAEPHAGQGNPNTAQQAQPGQETKCQWGLQHGGCLTHTLQHSRGWG